MISLLDVNILIALGDSLHSHADAALKYFTEHAVKDGWATCPLTENAFLRILGNPKYPNGPESPEEARNILQRLIAAPGHQFWADDISFASENLIPTLPASSNLTDCYLLALAVNKGAKFVTFDQNIDASLVKHGAEAMCVLDVS